MRMLVLGAGAVGGYFGGRLAQAGEDVTFLVREARKTQLDKGLTIVSPRGNVSVPVATLVADQSADQSAEPFDVIVLTCKSYSLSEALDAIAPHVGAGTVILPLLNGVSHMETIRERFPAAFVWGGVAQIAATVSDDGSIRHLSDFHNLVVGNFDGQEATDGLVDRLVESANAAGVDARRSQDIEQDLWDKWTFLTTLAGATCSLRADIGTILNTESGKTVLHGLFDECVAVTSSAGRRPDENKIAAYLGLLSDPRSTLTASMLRDMEQNRPIEADHIVGDMVGRAVAAGIPTPFLHVAWAHLQCYERLR